MLFLLLDEDFTKFRLLLDIEICLRVRVTRSVLHVVICVYRLGPLTHSLGGVGPRSFAHGLPLLYVRLVLGRGWLGGRGSRRLTVVLVVLEHE